MANKAANKTELQCYQYDWGTTGRGEVEDYCNYEDSSKIACPTGSCYKDVEYRMQRKYEIHGGCCQDCSGKTKVCTTAFCNIANKNDDSDGSIKWWGWLLIAIGVIAVCGGVTGKKGKAAEAANEAKPMKEVEVARANANMA
jgi:hypothetical protein